MAWLAVQGTVHHGQEAKEQELEASSHTVTIVRQQGILDAGCCSSVPIPVHTVQGLKQGKVLSTFIEACHLH